MIANILKKLFGGIDLTWPKLLIASVLAGVYTAAVCIIPALQDTSFHTIAVTFEVWILFGILIIMNSKSNLDAALKCFVFFLISQPLVYLLQVPFSWQGWGLFGYYKYWFLWTLLCFPMGYVGYYMKRGKWWGYLILLPMLGFTAYAYLAYFSDFLFSRPRYVLISLFCALWLILYPVAIFADKRIKTVGAAVGRPGGGPHGSLPAEPAGLQHRDPGQQPGTPLRRHLSGLPGGRGLRRSADRLPGQPGGLLPPRRLPARGGHGPDPGGSQRGTDGLRPPH